MYVILTFNLYLIYKESIWKKNLVDKHSCRWKTWDENLRGVIVLMRETNQYTISIELDKN